jgi:uncharacterized protein
MFNPDISPAGATPTPTSRERGEVAATPLGTLVTLPARAASGLVWLYQRTLSPALAVLNPAFGCRFTPTCSCYARGALAEHGLLGGSALTLRRLAKCGPWHPGGEDPVPLRARPTCTSVHPQV